MARSTVDSTKVGFSAGARVFEGDLGAAEASLRPMGLLGADATLNIGQTTRQKQDRFPQVIVAQAILQQSAEMSAVLHELTVDNLRAAFGLEAADLTATAGGDVVVANENAVFDVNNNAVLANPIKTSVAPVVTNVAGSVTYVAGTDYILIPRDQFGRTVLYRLAAGAIGAGATVHVDYTWTRVTRTEFPIGSKSKVVERKVKLEEEYTDGRKLVAVMYRAVFAINGNLTVNTDGENGMSVPVTISGLFDPGQNKVASIYIEG
jgi:hypothetical protein